MSASFEEKSVWIQLASMVAALGGYGYVAGNMLAAGVLAPPAYVAVFSLAVAAIVVINVVGHVALALTGRVDSDERDRMIGWRAEGRSGWLLGTGVIGSIGCLVFGVEPLWVAHALLLSLFLSQLLCFVLQLVDYRRGF